jgi:hypothetical protein
LISVSSISHRFANAHSAILADAVVEVGAPGRSAAIARIKRHLAGHANKPLTQRLRRVHQQRLERDHGLCSRLERGVAGDL